ncbi:hypothetical protein FUAX_52670 (plasmid) [Fulvitalea axinellae]|uniref:Uncharacterized protein n=1 Tax=Fulvitalea axinellae TaxID=1182444 RepID=A0AAU9DNQ9_9BACT|nr:hypothetical protein FUAX_52670 [Fulvitalea axinellae]
MNTYSANNLFYSFTKECDLALDHDYDQNPKLFSRDKA